MRLHPIGPLVPDRTDRELALLDAKGGLGVRELHVGPPQRLSVPVGDIGAQHVAALAVPRPLAPLGPGRPLQAKPGRPGWILDELNRVPARGPRVALEEPPDLAFELAAVKRSAGVVDP